MLAAGIRFWQLGESYYWGHNAILRVAPFVRHCGLARLPGKAPLGGEILSHDFVEAGLMGKAGWEVWVVPELAGSYEELPPTLLDELKRDRRWCQGNIQHLRLLLSDAIRGGHRAILSTGIMAYASAFFWFVFLLLVTGEVVAKALLPPVYFSSQPSLFPIWPQWRPGWAIALLSTTIVLLFLPKFLSLLLIVKDRATRLFGGFIPLCTSIVLEILASTLLAPVRMWFHSKFVALTLMGREIKWGAQRRTGNQIGWGEALRFHGFSIIFSVGVVAVMSWLNPSFLWWLLPVLVPLLLSVPLSVYSSRIAAGSALHRWRLFLIPEEVDPPDVIRELQTSIAQRERNKWKPDPFVRAIIDPYANAIHAGLLHGKTSKSPEAVERNTRLREIALTQGPASLNRLEKAYLLRDAQSMAFLQAQVWQLRDPHLVAQWGIAELD
jgi:membrane glycosyltransferase